MTEAILSSLQIQKLGHNIQEIRERALQNIISKLKFGAMQEKDLGQIKEILQKLFSWFQLTPLSYAETVLNLIQRILESQHGPCLINFYTPKMLVNELVNIGKIVSKSCHNILDDIVTTISVNQTEDAVPCLESEFPLSAKAGKEDCYDSIGTAASTIAANINEEASIELRLGPLVSDRTDSTNITTSNSMNVEKVPCKYYTLPWQSLVGPDCHVLESVEESLRNPSQPTALIHSCEFFNDVLLQDFPAEVFLQRSAIITLFQHLLSTCRSSRITSATLMCLNKLTMCLKTRMYFFSDPNTHNLKLNAFISSSLPSPASGDHSNISPIIYPVEDISFLKSKQLPIPQFCLSTINCVLNYLYVKPISLININERPTRKICQIGINTSLVLLHELINVLKLCLASEIWQHKSSNSTVKEILQMFQECLIKCGDLLEHFRIILFSNQNQSERISYLLLISNTRSLLDILPSDEVGNKIPKCLKTALSALILDAPLSRLFPHMHQSILEIVKKFDGQYEVTSCSKYEEIESIFDSMTDAIKFLNKFKELPLYESIHLVQGGLSSLEFHRDFSFIMKFLDLCSSRLSLHCYEEDVFVTIDYITQALLSHVDKEIQCEVYKICRKIVTDTIGPKFCSSSEPGSQILFLLRPMALKEIILHGCSSENEMIVDCANDILIHILKSKILVSSIIWQKTVEVLIINWHILLCYASNKTSLSKTLMSMLDPDKAEKLQIPIEQVIKGNCCLLFSTNALFRAEAVSRVCWLLSLDPCNSKLLPKLSNLHDKALGLICQLNRIYDLNKIKHTQHFYQPSSLHQVMDLLTSTAAVEPVIRRSALVQISVMTEDPLLHIAFQERDGLAVLIAAMRNALTESNYGEYPDSVIPIFATLKNICLYNAVVREELSCNMDAIHFIIRGLVLFCTDNRAKEDGSILLFLLLFNSAIMGCPSKHDLSIQQLVQHKLKIPFICKTYSRNSPSSLPTLASSILRDKWCLSALRIHWNSEWFGGFKQILNWPEVSYDCVPFNDILKLTQSDLDGLKCASLEFCIRENLKEVSSASSPNIENAINKLISCLNLYRVTKNDYTSQTSITEFQWKEYFLKFTELKPSDNEDCILLTQVLHFFTLLAPIYQTSDDSCWISSILRDKTHCLTDLLDHDFSNELNLKKISQALHKLITVCASNDQSFLCLYKTCTSDSENNSNWYHLVIQIINHLNINNTQRFYNLAYLDSLLNCLANLTVILGWSNKNSQNISVQSKQLLSKLISSLYELLQAFHSGKGSSASSSLMGLSITRNIIIILCHTLVEVQHFNICDWEDLVFNDYLNEENILTDLSSLLLNRDVILRAAVVQLFTGFAWSLKLAIKLVQNFQQHHLGLWETFLAILLDHDEASIVRENVAALLTNILCHAVQNRTDPGVVAKLLPLNGNKPSDIESLMQLLEESRFYKEIEIILLHLYIENEFYYDCANSNASTVKPNSPVIPILSSNKEEYIFAYTKNIPLTIRSVSPNGLSSTSDNQPIITTPGLVKNLAQFLNQLLLLASTEISDILQENNIIRLFFRCLTIPTKDIQNTKDLTNYCEIIFMNKSLVNTISTAVNASTKIKCAVLHTRDCLSILITLLNSRLFCIEIQQLLHLRNDLWLDIFILLTNTLQTDNVSDINLCKSVESVNTIVSVIEEYGFEIFIETICDSLERHNLSNLQHSALSLLISLLRIATISDNSKNIMQILLDAAPSPRFDPLQYEDQLENISPNIKKTSTNASKIQLQKSILENVYFGNIAIDVPTQSMHKIDTNEVNHEQTLKAGGGLCKILIKLYELHTIRNIKNSKLKYVLIYGLAGILYTSIDAKEYAYENNFMLIVIQQLKDIYIKLSLESITSMRRVAEKKRLHPILKEMAAIFGLLTNFIIGRTNIKKQASVLGLADLVHKLWIWCYMQKGLIVDVLKMLCTYTTTCVEACQSLTTTSSIAGLGPRKQPNFSCLMHVIIVQIGKEMDLISRTHDLATIQLCFHLLQNSSEVTECRNVIVKSNLLQFISRLHPAITKRQKSYENIELIWLNFLLIFTGYIEGQSCVAKTPDAFDLLITMTNCTKEETKLTALMILRNLVFYAPNRPRLLHCVDFMKVLDMKLTCGSLQEQHIVVTIIWSMASNNQKAKLIFKVAHLDLKLHEAIKILQVSEDIHVSSEVLKQMYHVLNLLRTGGK